VVVHLRYRRTVAGEQCFAFAITIQNALITLRLVIFHPRQERWSEVKTDASVIVDDLRYAPIRIEDPRCTIRQVALAGDPLISIMVRDS
jgi:hypothetical protein